MTSLVDSLIQDLGYQIHRSKSYAAMINSAPLIDIGAFGEALTCDLFKTLGSGTSGGGSFDTSSGHEVKTLCKLQSKTCKDCEFKNAFFVRECHSCGSSEFKYANDTRAGISTKSHFDHINELHSYVVYDIIPDKLDESASHLNLTGWIIQKDNKFFNSLLLLQHKHGRAKNKNLLTSSIEFSLSAPCKFFEAKVDISKPMGNHSIIVHDLKYNKNMVPLIHKEKFFSTKYREYIDLIPDTGYNSVINDLNIVAILGTQGKARGKTQRKNLMTG